MILVMATAMVPMKKACATKMGRNLVARSAASASAVRWVRRRKVFSSSSDSSLSVNESLESAYQPAS